MRLLVTGGAGFIGTNFVQYILTTEPLVEVTVLDAFTYAAYGNNFEYFSQDITGRLTVVPGDICNPDLVDQLVAAHDVVVHLAAESHNDNSLTNPRVFVETNIVGTFHIVQSVLKHNRRLHHVSTDEVYGDLPLAATDKFNEDSPYRPSSPYSATKASSDMLVRSWIRSFGLNATISGCSNNYGPFQHIEKFIPRQITNLIDSRRPSIYGTGKNVRDWIHVLDHCSALWKIVTDGQVGRTYLIGANAERSNLEIAQIILTNFGKDAQYFNFVEDRAGHDLRYAIDATRIESELGWRPQHTDLDRGIAGTIDWYQRNERWWRPAKAATELKYRMTGH